MAHVPVPRIVIHPPSSEKYRAFCGLDGSGYPRPGTVIQVAKSYLRRDRDIVDASSRIIATPRPGSRGTSYTVDYANRLLRSVWVVKEDGTLEVGRI
jgi:hypothetical protein